jgi:hypoxanthine phosphoribosyltransferase
MNQASQKIQLKDKVFKPYISAEKINLAIKEVSEKINSELMGEDPLFLVVLNGSFMFAADLLRKITIPCSISFIKVASYHGVSSSGSVTELIGLTEEIKDRKVVIIEDIVDTGTTLEKLHHLLQQRQVKDIRIATLLFKPEAYKKAIKVDYPGLTIPNDFVVGYGLDYDGLGRNLPEIFVLDSNHGK